MNLQQHEHSWSAMAEQFISESACSKATVPVFNSFVRELFALGKSGSTSCVSAWPARFVSIKAELMCWPDVSGLLGLRHGVRSLRHQQLHVHFTASYETLSKAQNTIITHYIRFVTKFFSQRRDPWRSVSQQEVKIRAKNLQIMFHITTLMYYLAATFILMVQSW